MTCAEQLGNATDFLKLIAKIDHFCLGIGTDVNVLLLKFYLNLINRDIIPTSI